MRRTVFKAKGLLRSLQPLHIILPSSAGLRPSRFPRRLCKLCDATDWRDQDWLHILDEMKLSYQRDPKLRNRKTWEWVHGIYGLKLLGFLNDKTSALGVGSGKELALYYLANHVHRVLATDLYQTSLWSEAPKAMLTKPELFAPFPYREDHLSVQHMDGLNLALDDDSFDIIFSFSAIEHFGGHPAATRAMREMARVLRPQGLVVLTTELILNGAPHPEFFLPEEINHELIEPSGLKLVEDIDFSLSEETLASRVVNLDHFGWQSITPHYILRHGKWLWTSVLFFLEKPH